MNKKTGLSYKQELKLIKTGKIIQYINGVQCIYKFIRRMGNFFIIEWMDDKKRGDSCLAKAMCANCRRIRIHSIDFMLYNFICNAYKCKKYKNNILEYEPIIIINHKGDTVVNPNDL